MAAAPALATADSTPTLPFALAAPGMMMPPMAPSFVGAPGMGVGDVFGGGVGAGAGGGVDDYDDYDETDEADGVLYPKP